MRFYCRECGKTSERYFAQCPSCKATNALQEGSPRDAGWVRASGGAQLLHEVERKDVDRIVTGTRELDRVLAGGFGLEATYILSGEPGAGKSTLIEQVMGELCAAEVGEGEEPWRVLYVAGEEPKEQIAARFDRILPESKSGTLKLHLVNETDVLEVEKLVAELDPDVVVIDSINTMVMKDLDARAGGVVAIQTCAKYLCGLSKARKACLVMIAHVTKGDDLAGPKTFEHLVDGVMHLANEEPFRVLRMSKHRLGPTSEVGVFKMSKDGLQSVENPSELLLEAHVDGIPGSVVAVTADGSEGASRALLVEVQALVMGGEGTYQAVTGLEASRVKQVSAILAARMGREMKGETFVSIAGGLKLKDAGLDLAVALAMLSSFLGEEMPAGFACFGELGLAGEVRMPKNAEGRVKSALAMHVDILMSPPLEEKVEGDVEHVPVRTLREACDWLGWDVAPRPTKKARRGKAKK